MAPKLLFTILLVAAFLASGCLESDDQTPQEQVLQAMDRFQDDLGPDGDVKMLTGEANAEGMTIDLEIEFGTDNGTRFDVDAGMMFQAEIVCTQGRTFMSYGNGTYESRYDEEICKMDFDEGPGIPLSEQEEEFEIVEITTRDDGALVAVVKTVEDGEESLMTVVVKDGRVIEMVMEDEEGEFTFYVEYGTRSAIPVPETDGRIPAQVIWDTRFEAGEYNGTVREMDHELSLEEFQVHVYDMDGELLAGFPTSVQGEQESDDFTFVFQDDGDGLLGAGDTFQISHPDWEHQTDYDVDFFDEWAGVRTDDAPVPAVGLVPLLVLMVAGVPVLRRLRR